MSFRLVCFDMDGVLFRDINFWLELHKQFGTYEEGVAVTKQFLHTDYARLVKEVVARLWKGKDAAPYYALINSLVYIDGIEELFAHIKKRGYITAIISASSIDACRRVQRDFGVDYLFANELIIRDEKVTGEFVWPIGAGDEKKARVLRQLCHDLAISSKEVIYIGDSEKDIQAFEEVGLAIAFNSSSDKLKRVAHVVIDKMDLREIIHHIP